MGECSVCTYVRAVCVCSIYACVSVFSRVVMSVRMYVWSYVRMYVRMYVCTYVRMYVRTYVRTFVCLFVCNVCIFQHTSSMRGIYYPAIYRPAKLLVEISV